MSKYADYFNELKEGNDALLYKGGMDLRPTAETLWKVNHAYKYDYNATKKMSDSHKSEVNRQNNMLGGVQLLGNVPTILPIDAYKKQIPDRKKDAKKSAINFSSGMGAKPKPDTSAPKSIVKQSVAVPQEDFYIHEKVKATLLRDKGSKKNIPPQFLKPEFLN